MPYPSNRHIRFRLHAEKRGIRERTFDILRVFFGFLKKYLLWNAESYETIRAFLVLPEYLPVLCPGTAVS